MLIIFMIMNITNIIVSHWNKTDFKEWDFIFAVPSIINPSPAMPSCPYAAA